MECLLSFVNFKPLRIHMRWGEQNIHSDQLHTLTDLTCMQYCIAFQGGHHINLYHTDKNKLRETSSQGTSLLAHVGLGTAQLLDFIEHDIWQGRIEP